MTGATYPAARAAAAAIERHFREFAALAAAEGESPAAPVPDGATVEAILSVAFWASLRREEGRSPRISIVYLPADRAVDALTFLYPLPFDATALTRLAPAVERPSIHLGVWPASDALAIWGTTRSIPVSSFVVEVVEPGLLVVKRRRGREGGKFANVALLEGDQVLLIDEDGGEMAAHPAIASGLLGQPSRRSWSDPLNILVQLAVSIRGHGHGGTLLIVPASSDGWRESIVPPIPYPVEPPYRQLAGLASMRPEEAERARHREALRSAVSAVGGLTAVDGATILSDGYELLAFGAKIGRRKEAAAVDRVRLVQPFSGHEPRLVDTAELGGTRHLSAAQFVHDQPGALALVASQDGRFTVFAGDPDERIVHAHRVEALLL